MKGSSLRLVVPAALLCAAAVLAPLRAHQVAPQVSVWAREAGDRFQLFVRLPATVLGDPRLPVRPDGYFDLQAGLDRNFGPMASIAADVARNLDLMNGDRPVTPASVAWTISPPGTPFGTFDAAAARFLAGPGPDSRIDPSEALIDLRLEYPAGPAPNRFSLRVNGYRGPRDGETVVRYQAPSGDLRTVVTTGTPRRVELEPRWQSAASLFGRLGAEQLTLAVVHLMFVLSLAIPARPLRNALTMFGLFAGGWILALAASGLLRGVLGASALTLAQMAAAAALAVAALQNITGPRRFWILLATGVFGVLDGLVLGAAFWSNVSLAGSHPLAALLSYAMPILVGSLWLLLVAHPVVVMIRRTRLAERWATVLLSAVPIHAALHVLMLRR